MFKKFIKKIKETKNKFGIILLGLFVLLNIGAAAYFIYSIWVLSGIEDIIRYGIMALAVVMAIIFIRLYICTVIKGKKLIYVLFTFFLLISIAAQGYAAFNIFKIYKPINNINKSTITYTTDLIVLKSNDISDINDLKNMTIGMIAKNESKEDYEIANDIIIDNKLKDNNEIKKYNDYGEMLNDLYDGKIDAVLITSKYETMFNSIEKFQNIKDEVKVITSKSKDFKKQEEEKINTKDIVKEPFTILLMGVDSEKDGLNKDAAFNGDSLMLITFNPTTLNATVLSIPRDTYVPIMCFANHKQNKITHASWQGVDCMKRTIENFTGIDIDYYVKMNFKGVVDLVNALGGVDVDVPMNFCEQNSDRAWGDKEICLKKGQQHLNGEQALALARHRKTLELGDIQRGLNQQLVIEGMLKKVSNIDSVDEVNDLLNTVSKNMDTNLSTNQILSFYNVAKNVLIKSSHTTTDDLISMEKLYLDGYTKMIYDASFGFALSDYIYYKSSLEAVVDAMKVNLELQKSKMVKTFDFSINEVYETKLIGQGEKDKTSSISTLPSFIGDSKSYVTSWANARNIKVSFTEVKKGDKYYNEKYENGTVVSQSVAAGSDMSSVGSITFGILVKDTSKPETTTSACTKGTTNSKCYMPNLIGKTRSEVDEWSRSLPVSVIFKEVFNGSSKTTDQVVISVNISTGSLLEEGSTITITYDDAKKPDNQDENKDDNDDKGETTDPSENGDPALDSSGIPSIKE